MIMKEVFTRVPQDLAYNADVLERTYQKEAPIIRDVLIYVSYKQLRNIFGEVTFTLKDFCEEFGYNRTTLQRKLKRLSDLKIVPEYDGHVYETYFEYALFRALKENVTFVRFRDGKKYVIAVNLINQIVTDYNKSTTKKTKRIYTVSLGDKIFDSLLQEYNLINFSEYKSLRAKQIETLGGYRNFYVFMARMIAKMQHIEMKNRTANIKQPEVYVTSIDELCETLSIEATEPKHKKQQLTICLDDIQSQLTSTHFEWKYVPNDSTRLLYYVEFRFSKETLQAFNEKLKAVFYKKLYNSCITLFVHTDNASRTSLVSLKEAYLNLDKKAFFAWLTNGENQEQKVKKFKEVYFEVYNTPYEFEKIDFSFLPI